jgi:lipopolysaccharide transport system ATP-binding protein
MGRIVVQGLGKAYRQYPSRAARLAEWLLPWGRPRHQLKWVLRDISFEIAPGEAVGIIGINGAGKSTLLKMITGTSAPTEGQVQLEGRVAALLELGMGFHPDFSGRQNVWMAGQLLGMSADELQRLWPEIEAFAEIGPAVDEPVRLYSSGMQMRLAFAVATCRRPDILIVDEALSVGDAYFQHKSFQRIRQYAAQGTTLLIVSHDKAAIQSICSRALLLDRGRLAYQGEPEAVMDYYNALIGAPNVSVSQTALADGRLQTVSGSGEAVVSAIELLDTQGRVIEAVTVGQPVVLRVRVEVRADLPSLVLGYGIKDRLGQVMYGTNTWHTGQVLRQVKAGSRHTFQIAFDCCLGGGSYSVQTALVASDTHHAANYEWRDLALVFEVLPASDQPVFTGMAWLPSTITIQEDTA